MLRAGNFIDSGGDSLRNRNHRAGCAHNLSLDDGGTGCGHGWRSAPDSLSQKSGQAGAPVPHRVNRRDRRKR
jgi:hypothetical protein